MKMNLQLIHFLLVDEEEAVQQIGGIKEKSLNHTVLDHLQNYYKPSFMHVHTHTHAHAHAYTHMHMHIVVT